MRKMNEDTDDEIRKLKSSVELLLPEINPEFYELRWDKFSVWMHCVCVVTFDLELGQALEVIYPEHMKLTEREKMNVCYLSFPDSNSGCMGDTQFHFRIRQSPSFKKTQKNYLNYNRNCPAPLSSDQGHYYGYVYFRQTKDKTIPRGYFQKSVVLLSKFPFVKLFSHVASVIAPEYFDKGITCLEAACHDIDQWPSPKPGETINLPILGSVLQVRIPNRSDKLIGSISKQQNVQSLPANIIIPSLHDVDLYCTAFQPVLVHIQMIWEIVLTGEPLVVMANLPTTCSQMVQALINIIWPLSYMNDYRPYFTIHDSEFKEYTTRTQAPPCMLMGVTNPFFAKTLQHWPHIIRLNEDIGGTNKSFNKLKKGGSIKTLDSKPGIYTKYKPFLQKDKIILKRLIKGMQAKRPSEVQNSVLKRYLLELTQSFMIPLERYVASLMPLQRNISPHKDTPRLKSFDVEEFLKTLEYAGPQLTSGLKGDWVGLYRQFFKSSNFQGWLKLRASEIEMKLQMLHVEALCCADLVDWIKDKHEVEVVDLVLKLREKIQNIKQNQIPVSQDIIVKLLSHQHSIILSLPEDLQTVLNDA